MRDSSDGMPKKGPGLTRRQRRRCELFSELTFVYEGQSEEISLRLPDFSTTGMFINTTKHFPVGAVLKVRFRLSRQEVVVHARAEVRYCLPGVGVGVEFLELSPEATRAIEKEFELAGLPPA